MAPAKAEDIRDFIDVLGPFPFPIVGNPKRDFYRLLGVSQPHTFQMLGYLLKGLLSGRFHPKQLLPEGKAKRRIYFHAIRTQDVNIQGSTLLLDPDGLILWKHRDKDPEDHARIPAILQEIERVQPS